VGERDLLSAPRVHTYPHGRQPAVWLWDGRTWQWCTVLARMDYGGRIAYQVQQPSQDSAGSSIVRVYWWGEDWMVLASTGR
jgi:hypothetical protein